MESRSCALFISDSKSDQATKGMVLWRGLKNVKPTDRFAQKGGTEVSSQVSSLVEWELLNMPHNHLLSVTNRLLFMVQLAPMSTTTDIGIAASYSISRESLIFKITTKNKLQRGADLQWVSAFPNEAEILYPPLTYLQPTGRQQVIEVDSHHFTIVEVTPTLA
jgi:hypothetical protein